MDNLNTEIKNKILEFLKTTKFGASSSEISKSIGHNRITVTKYLEIMKAHKQVTFEGVAQAKLWRVSEKRSRQVILIVDDEPHIADLIALSLIPERYRIIKSYSGIDALDKVHKEAPDLIILDLMMPGMNGYEVCKKVKENALTQHIPIMILSAKGDIDDKLKGLKTGADDYMTKPFDPMELEARVSAILRKTSIDQDMHPLTRLPGRNSINSHIQKKALGREDFMMYIIEIEGKERFKKEYGFQRWENLIMIFSRMLPDALEGQKDTFIGHAITDTFAITFVPGRQDNGMPDEIIMERFADMLPYIYTGGRTGKGSLALKITSIEGRELRRDKAALPAALECIGVR